MDERNKILKAAGEYKRMVPFYKGPYGTIDLLICELDNRLPPPLVQFISTKPGGDERTRSTLREAMTHLQVPYFDGSLPLDE